MSRGSSSAQTMEAEPPDMRYQAEPSNEYNHLGLLYKVSVAKGGLWFIINYLDYIGITFRNQSNESKYARY